MRFITRALIGSLLTLSGALAQQPSEQAPEPPAKAALVDPAAPAESNTPPLADWRVRRKELFTQMIGMQAFMETVPGMLFDTARNFPHEWGRTWKGVGRRMGTQYAQFGVSESIEFTFSAVRHEDPRFFVLGSGPAGKRVLHAIKRTFVTIDTRDGRDRLAIGKMAGVYGSFAASQPWSPGSIQGIVPLIAWGSYGMGTKVGVNILREFTPDLKRRFRRK